MGLHNVLKIWVTESGRIFNKGYHNSNWINYAASLQKGNTPIYTSIRLLHKDNIHM